MGQLNLTGNSSTRKRLGDLTAPTPFAPTDLSNLWAWYDASDTATITTTSNNVDQWDDKSGNGRHLTGSGATRPQSGTRTVNSLNVIDFQAGDFLTRTTSISFPTGTYTLAMYILDDGGAANGGLIVFHNGSGNDYDNVNSFVLENSDASNKYALVSNSLDICKEAGAGVIPQGSYIFRHNTGVTNGDTEIRPSGTRVDGTHVVTGTATGGILLGTRYISGAPDTHYYDGVHAELAIYSAAKSDSDLTTLRNYLIAKWGS